MSFNHVNGNIVEFHLRALRVLRGIFLPISAANHSFLTLTLLDERRQVVAPFSMEPVFSRNKCFTALRQGAKNLLSRNVILQIFAVSVDHLSSLAGLD